MEQVREHKADPVNGSKLEQVHWPAGRRVWFVAAEATPFIKVGGLADVAGELPHALRRLGVEVTLCLPLHGPMSPPESSCKMHELEIKGLRERWGMAVQPGAYPLPDGMPCKIREWDAEGLSVRTYDLPGLFGREHVYAYPDDSERFAVFCLAVAADAEADPNPPSILHLNDWHTAALAMLVHHAPKTGSGSGLRDIRTLLSIHSLEYQGRDRPSLVELYGTGPAAMKADGAAFEGGFNALKAGIAWADAIATVSPTYAREILKPGNGFGLDGFLAQRVKALKKGRYAGILNRLGDAWDPAVDAAIPVQYDSRSIGRRKRNKTALQMELGLSDSQGPLAIHIGRLVPGKGPDLLLEGAEAWLAAGMQLAVLGVGEPGLEAQFRRLSSAFPGGMAFRSSFDDALARRMYAGGDLLLMPSRREACGLSQQIAMRYGCLPVVRKTGGLADTVAEGENGFVFSTESGPALDRAVRRALRCYREKTEWLRMIRTAMRCQSGWEGSALEYVRLYLDLLTEE